MDRYRGSFKEQLAHVQAFERYDDATMTAEQDRRLLTLLRYALDHVPFYQENVHGNPAIARATTGRELLESFPTITKASVKQAAATFISDEFEPSGLKKYPTGGTSGSPLVLRYTKAQIRHNFAFAEARIRNWAGVTYQSRQATFLGKRIVPVGQQRVPYWRDNWAGNQRLFSIFHLNRDTAPHYIRALSQFRPEAIVGYVTPLYLLSRFILDSGRPLGWSPRLIWTSSETLLDSQRSVIEAAFGCRVTNAYSGAEGVALITQCPHGGLHISPDFGYVELIPIKGGSGLHEIVGTTLINWSMPLVRYRTGDLVVPATKPCDCGLPFPTVAQILGRLDDAVVTPGGVRVSSAPLSLVFQETPGVVEAQIVQTSALELLVRVVPQRESMAVPVGSIISGLRERVGADMDIRVEFVEGITRAENGKFRFIVDARNTHSRS